MIYTSDILLPVIAQAQLYYSKLQNTNIDRLEKGKKPTNVELIERLWLYTEALTYCNDLEMYDNSYTTNIYKKVLDIISGHQSTLVINDGDISFPVLDYYLIGTVNPTPFASASTHGKVRLSSSPLSSIDPIAVSNTDPRILNWNEAYNDRVVDGTLSSAGLLQLIKSDASTIDVGNVILNQNAAGQSSTNFWIDGVARANGGFRVGKWTVIGGDATTLNINSTSATGDNSITFGRNGLGTLNLDLGDAGQPVLYANFDAASSNFKLRAGTAGRVITQSQKVNITSDGSAGGGIEFTPSGTFRIAANIISQVQSRALALVSTVSSGSIIAHIIGSDTTDGVAGYDADNTYYRIERNSVNFLDMTYDGRVKLFNVPNQSTDATRILTQEGDIIKYVTPAELIASEGIINGSGTANKLPIWTDTDTLGDSYFTQSSSAITMTLDQSAATSELKVSNPNTTVSTARAALTAQSGTVISQLLSISGSGLFLGTASNHRLSLIMNGTEYLGINATNGRIQTNQAVDTGEDFIIGGTARVNGNLGVVGNIVNNYTISGSTYGLDSIGLTKIANGLLFRLGAISGVTNGFTSQLNASNDGVIYSFDYGNVGIGVIPTNAKLEVVATTGEVFRADASGGAARIVADQTGVSIGGVATLLTTPTTSAGTFDLITRNTSTGVLEKVASNYYATAGSISGTTGRLAKFTSSGAVGDSILTEGTRQIQLDGNANGITQFIVSNTDLTSGTTRSRYVATAGVVSAEFISIGGFGVFMGTVSNHRTSIMMNGDEYIGINATNGRIQTNQATDTGEHFIVGGSARVNGQVTTTSVLGYRLLSGSDTLFSIGYTSGTLFDRLTGTNFFIAENGSPQFTIASGGAATFKSGAGRPIAIQKSSAFTGSFYIEYLNSAGSSIAYVGYGSGGNDKFQVFNGLAAASLSAGTSVLEVGFNGAASSLNTSFSIGGSLTLSSAPNLSASSYSVLTWNTSTGAVERVTPNSMKRTTVADANYTVLSTDELVVYTSLTADRTVTLPAPGAGTSSRVRKYIIKDETGSASANNITLIVTSSGTIDGSLGKIIAIDYGSIEVYDNGTSYFTISQ